MDYFHFEMDEQALHTMSNLGLAYLGDAVFALMVRSFLSLRGARSTGAMNRQALRYVTAPAQAAMAGKLLPLLTQEEQEVFRRGRNTKPSSVPKAAKRGEYQMATALETLFGFLFLRGETERLSFLFDAMVEERGAAPCL